MSAPDPADLAKVRDRAAQVWHGEAAEIWLTSPNAYLDGARPLDVLCNRGPDEVLDALEAVVAGAYA